MHIAPASLGANVSAFVHAAGYFHDGLLSHHLDGGVSDFAVYDAYQSIYPKAFVAISEGALSRMGAGGRIVAISNPGCNSQQTPRVGYDMPGQGKATMEFAVRMYAMRTAKRGICVNAVSPGYTDTAEWDKARLTMGQGDLDKGRQLLDARMLSRSPVARWAAPDEIAQVLHAPLPVHVCMRVRVHVHVHDLTAADAVARRRSTFSAPSRAASSRARPSRSMAGCTSPEAKIAAPQTRRARPAPRPMPRPRLRPTAAWTPLPQPGWGRTPMDRARGVGRGSWSDWTAAMTVM